MLNHPLLENSVPVQLDDLLVVKIGGGAGLDLHAACADAAIIARQRPVVIVHGVSAEADALCAERGIPVRTITSPSGHSSRYTDAATRAVYVEAARNVSRQIVSTLGAAGVPARAVNGAITGIRKDAVRAVINGKVQIIRDNYTGSIQQVTPQPIFSLLAQGIVPVIPPEAWSETDGILNIDGDRGAAAIAAALGAQALIILSNVRGLYRRFPDDSTLVPRVNSAQIEDALRWAEGRMKRKVLGAQEALQGGVQRVVIADGRNASPIQAALAGSGTEFLP